MKIITQNIDTQMADSCNKTGGRFASALLRLHNVTGNRQPGEQLEVCRVQRADLRALLHHFNRLESDLARLNSERSYIVGCNEGFEAAIEQAARLIDDNVIMDTSAGKTLVPRHEGDRAGLHYAVAIRTLAGANEASNV